MSVLHPIDTTASSHPEACLLAHSLSLYIVGSYHIYFLQPLIITLRDSAAKASSPIHLTHACQPCALGKAF